MRAHPENRPLCARRLPVGAEAVAGGVHLRVWAPRSRRVEAVFEGPQPGSVALEPEPGGYHGGLAPGRQAGARYRFRLEGGELWPDPASRFQPDGPEGASEVIDPSSFSWRDAAWKGPGPRGQVFYELHVGTFSREGTWAAAARRLGELRELGVTAVEVMPVAEFPGRFNWGYDGVDLFSPTRNYGRPDDFRRFVDEAHALGLAVLLDVVYNHLGPDGSSLPHFSPAYFSQSHKTDWGPALNFDGPDCQPVREFMCANAQHWISEYHLDGLRFDATQDIRDTSREHIVAEIARKSRQAAAGRRILLVGEDEQQRGFPALPAGQGGWGLDAVWNDDFHHALGVALTGFREAYYQDYAGTAQELLSACKRGYLFQGQWSGWQKKRRGGVAPGLAPEGFVAYLENHDQVANASPGGQRLLSLASPARLRAATALLLLGPQTPLLFQGQERGTRRPFSYFADHRPGLSGDVARGRRRAMSQFPAMAAAQAQQAIPEPGEAFSACRCEEGEPSAEARPWLALHRDLLALRRADPCLSGQGPARLDGAVLARQALCLRGFEPHGADRLLLVNLGQELRWASLAEPLLAPPEGRRWVCVWCSEDTRYGGRGVPDFDEQGWFLPADSARLLAAEPQDAHGRS